MAKYFIALAAILIVAIVLIARQALTSNRKTANDPRSRAPSVRPPQTRVSDKGSYSFGYKTAWLAIRTEDRSAVLAEIRLADAKPVSWQEGIAAAYDDKGAFVSSPVQGWILVMDRELMNAVEPDKTSLAQRLIHLSRTFGEAQYFLNYRVSSGHAWIRAKDGIIERGYASLDGTIYWNEGRITPEELAIRVASAENSAKHMQRAANMKPETYSKEAEELTALAKRLAKMTPETYSEETDRYIPDEDDVIKIAGKWSIDPETLDENVVKDPNGVLGKLPEK